MRWFATQASNKAKTLKTDNGGEYFNAATKAVMSAAGVEHVTTAAHAPQQNGTAERFNRTILDKARALKIDLRAPDLLWPYCIETADYLWNASPPRRGGTSAHELFFGVPPDVAMQKPFGCRVLPLVPEVLRGARSKLDAKAVRGRLIGYTPGNRGWEVHLDDGRITTSAIVTLFEGDRQRQRQRQRQR